MALRFQEPSPASSASNHPSIILPTTWGFQRNKRNRKRRSMVSSTLKPPLRRNFEIAGAPVRCRHPPLLDPPDSSNLQHRLQIFIHLLPNLQTFIHLQPRFIHFQNFNNIQPFNKPSSKFYPKLGRPHPQSLKNSINTPLTSLISSSQTNPPLPLPPPCLYPLYLSRIPESPDIPMEFGGRVASFRQSLEVET